MGKHQITTLQPRIALTTLHLAPLHTTQTKRMTGSGLQKRRRRFLREHPLCVECEKVGRTSAATQLDHVIPLHRGGPDTEDNLQGLCDDCHEAKTTAEARERNQK